MKDASEELIIIDWNNNGRIDPEEIILTQFLLSEEDEEEEEDEFGEERERGKYKLCGTSFDEVSIARKGVAVH